MSKTGNCSFCSESVTIPNSQCLFICRFCSSKSLFLCHVIAEPKDPMHIRCKQCKNKYSLYNCPKCQACAAIKDFQSGKMYNCLCGFQATMLSCNQCTALLCLPNRKNYELTNIQCKQCSNSFKYRLCPTCAECTYLKPHQNPTDLPLCFNEQCPQSKKQYVKMEPPPQPQPKQSLKAGQGNPYEAIIQKPQDLCNICQQRQKCMVNLTCYHLSVCETCSKAIKGICPICRVPGSYKKIYRS